MSERVWWWREPSSLAVTAQLDEWYERHTKTRLERPRVLMFGARVYVDGSPEGFEAGRRYLERALRNTVAILTENTAVESRAYLYQFATGQPLVVLPMDLP